MKSLLISQFIIVFLLLSWNFPPLCHLWEKLDIAAAYFFNSFIQNHKISQNFWAFFNSSLADWLFDITMALFFLPYVFLAQKGQKLKRFIEISLIIFVIVLFYNLFNRGIFEKAIILSRESPFGVLPDLFSLNEVISWTHVKVHSSASYPGDHGYTICMFILSIYFLMGRRQCFFAFLASLPFLVPRLITGAHWVTDILMGSFIMALFILGWLFYTPLFTFLTSKIHSLIKVIFNDNISNENL